MMRHLFFLFFSLTILSVGYAQRAEQLLSVDTGNIKTQRLGVEETYSQSFPISSQKTASLEIKVGNRISLKEIARISLPVLATTVYGLLRHNNSASGLENKSDQSNLAPYAVGGAIVSGASFALRTHRKKALVKLTYHNLSGAVVQTESQWITMGKPTTINIKSNIDGWIDVTVPASKYHTIKIQYIKFVSEDNFSAQADKNKERISSSRLSSERINLKDSSNLINKDAISLVPNTSTQFDWQTAAFSKSDSVVLDTAISNSYQVVCYETYECFYRPDFSGSGAYAHYEISEKGHCSNVFINVSSGHRYYLESERYTGISCKPSFDDDDPNDPTGPGTGPGGPPPSQDTGPRVGLHEKTQECNTIKEMWNASLGTNPDGSKYPLIERAALITDKGLLVMPTVGNRAVGHLENGKMVFTPTGDLVSNTVSKSWFDLLGGFATDPNTGELLYRTYDGETYKVLGNIHTHPSTSIGNPQLPSAGDRGDQMCRTYGISMYIMGAEGITEYNNDGSLGVRWTPEQISGCNGSIF